MTEKRRSRNKAALQKQAADMMMDGYSADGVARHLNMRFDTIVRWQKSKVFTDRIALHKEAARQQIHINMTRALMEAGDYAARNPGGKLGNTAGTLIQIVKNAQLADI